LDVNGIKRNYFPDFVLSNTKVIEIKPRYWLGIKDEKITAKINAATEFFKLKNMEYHVITEREFKQLNKNELEMMISKEIITLKNNKNGEKQCL
jgi:hypothetical protein